ncbi:MAG: bifunctional UDP-N-acetylglucosamine diphosphorylase/glucosamine-1-phosphate N-acetyltransferase GlmU [Alphaproteobacteria bacterium]|nr:bifunctional UDP-N-acetylglucosamine diphosphorylase/glucosamine-1-phosphate N-acetyltransferase GlmU [Alphaproteobacteria bacterium]
MPTPPFSAIILAAGKGTRMKSDLPKVLHRVAGVSMLAHVIHAVAPLKPHKIITVVAPDMPEVEKAAKDAHPAVTCAVQPKQLGTADAVKAARKALGNSKGDVIILFGDTPLITSQTIGKALKALNGAKQPSVVVVGIRPGDPTGYGRLVTDAKGALTHIVEEKDATPAERKIGLCNSGIMAVKGSALFTLLDKVKPQNAQKEYYLTDIIAIARKAKLICHVAEADATELSGINSRAQLAACEAAMQERLRAKAMANGATLIDPASVFLSADTTLGRDVTIQPGVYFGPGVTVGDHVEIRAYSHIEGTTLHDHVTVGPFARLRPGTVIESGARIGNFVEVKNATLHAGAKANHLSYIGDAEVGRDSNIGAGTITCNYDGYRKSKTVIGEHVFIGSNSALVAPVTIADGAIVAAGSTITEDIAKDALVLARSAQTPISGGAAKFRKKRQKP